MKRELLRDVWIRRNEKSLKSDEVDIETQEDKEEKKESEKKMEIA